LVEAEGLWSTLELTLLPQLALERVGLLLLDAQLGSGALPVLAAAVRGGRGWDHLGGLVGAVVSGALREDDVVPPLLNGLVLAALGAGWRVDGVGLVVLGAAAALVVRVLEVLVVRLAVLLVVHLLHGLVVGRLALVRARLVVVGDLLVPELLRG